MLNVLRTKEIKKQIAQSPQNVQEIINNVTDLGICITDENGYFSTINPRYTEIYGYEKDEITGKHFSIVLPDDKKEKLSVLHDRFMDNKYEILRNWQVRRKDGTLINIQADAGYSEAILDKKPYKITFVYYEDK